MKKSELKALIREEIQRIMINEDVMLAVKKMSKWMPWDDDDATAKFNHIIAPKEPDVNKLARFIIKDTDVNALKHFISPITSDTLKSLAATIIDLEKHNKLPKD